MLFNRLFRPGLARMLSLVLAFVPAPLAVSAQMTGDSRLQMLGTSDAGRDWMAVGRLNVGARSFCTATLIAPDRVLTAAHCLFERESGQRVSLNDLEFLAGWRIGRAEAIRGVRRAVMEPGFSMEGAQSMARIANDLAVLELDRPIRLTGLHPVPLAGHTPAAGSAVAVVSYARARAEAPSLQERCTVIDRRRDRVLVLSCAIDFGASGAPVFSLAAGVPQIVSVISAMTASEGASVALGMQLAGRVDDLMARLDAPSATLSGAPSAPGNHGARSSARFVRP